MLLLRRRMYKLIKRQMLKSQKQNNQMKKIKKMKIVRRSRPKIQIIKNNQTCRHHQNLPVLHPPIQQKKAIAVRLIILKINLKRRKRKPVSRRKGTNPRRTKINRANPTTTRIKIKIIS